MPFSLPGPRSKMEISRRYLLRTGVAATGALLPYSPAEAADPTGAFTPEQFGAKGAATRAALAGLATTSPAYLSETGREGTFVFNSANLSANVTSDPRQAVYVPPTGQNGSTGAWVRRYSGAASALWFGAVADGITDNYAALQAWLDLGGQLYLSAGHYYCSQRLIIRKFVNLSGEGFSQDVRLVGYASSPGSRIRFPANVGGIIVQTFTNVDSTTLFNSNPALYTNQQGGLYSVIGNLGLLGGGGTTGTAFEARCRVFVQNIRAIGFGGKGFDIQGSADIADVSSDYGNASNSTVIDCHALQNGSHGFHFRGRDASVIDVTNCDASGNGGWGFLNDTIYGLNPVNCHTSVNTLGAVKSGNAISSTVWLNCYNEPYTGSNIDISALDKVEGGTLALTGLNNNSQPCRRSSGALVSGSGQYWIGSSTGAGAPYPQVTYGIGTNIGGSTARALNSWGAADSVATDLVSGIRDGHMVYNPVNKTFEFQPQNPIFWHGTGSFQRWPTDRSTDARAYAPGFDNGISVGSAFDGRIGFAPGGTVPDGVYKVSDVMLNGAVATGVGAFKVCITAGVKASTAWAAGQQFYTLGSAPYAAYFRTNAGNVYKLTGLTNTNGALNAPVHTSGTVTGADGYAWTWLNATTVPVFETRG